MLSVQRIKDRNYHINLARDDYYLSGGEPAGTWHGEGAQALGLNGPVQRDTLHQIMDGYGIDGRKLVQNAGETEVRAKGNDGTVKVHHREIGWDLTFSAPKSVSVVWSQAAPQIRDAIQHILMHPPSVKPWTGSKPKPTPDAAKVALAKSPSN